MTVSNCQALHARDTLGEELSPEEQCRLDAWYREQDQEEARLLGLSDRRETLVTPRQVEDLAEKVREIGHHIDLLKDRNEALRLEVAALRQEAEARGIPLPDDLI